jgi:PadR family transcriptional regulator PadR
MQRAPTRRPLFLLAAELASRAFVLQNKTMTDSLGSLELATLLAVARLGEDAYGLAVRRDVSAQAARDYSVGAIYTTLQRLEDKRLLTSRDSEPLPIRGGRSRRHFQLTTAGRRALQHAQQRAITAWAGIDTVLRPRST